MTLPMNKTPRPALRETKAATSPAKKVSWDDQISKVMKTDTQVRGEGDTSKASSIADVLKMENVQSIGTAIKPPSPSKQHDHAPADEQPLEEPDQPPSELNLVTYILYITSATRTAQQIQVMRRIEQLIEPRRDDFLVQDALLIPAEERTGPLASGMVPVLVKHKEGKVTNMWEGSDALEEIEKFVNKIR